MQEEQEIQETHWQYDVGNDEWLFETTSLKSQFVAAHKAAAAAIQASMGVPALVTLGQAALESGWGAHAPKFNFFGIKAKASDPEDKRQLLQTREVLSSPNHFFPVIISVTQRPDGKYLYIVKDWFRAFASAEEAFTGHAQFLVSNPRYAPAFAVGLDAYAFAEEVARAGYATDPNYGTVLASVMHSVEAAGWP